MVKFRSWTQSGCAATQLLFCLLIGLRLLSTSVQGATCGLPLRSSASSQQQETQDRHHIAPPASKWGVEIFDTFKPAPRIERRNGTASALIESNRSDPEEAVDKKSHHNTSNDCQKANEGKNKRSNCNQQPARDFVEQGRSKDASSFGSTPNTQPNDASSGSSSSLSSLTPSSGSDEDAGFDSSSSNIGPSSSSSTDSDSNTFSAPASSNNGSLESSSLPSSSSLSPSTWSQSSPQDPPPPPNGTQPNISFNESPSQPQDASSGTSIKESTSSGSATLQPNPGSSSNRKTKAIAAGVTVPVGVLALGLIALVILHKQRQKRRSNEQGHTLSGGQNEEIAETPATQNNTPRLGALELLPMAPLTAASSHGHAGLAADQGAAIERQDERDGAGTEASSAVSHAVATSRPVTPAATASNTPKQEGQAELHDSPGTEGGASTSSHVASSPANMRGKSLKRKPVPALLETFEATKLNPTPSETQLSSATHSLSLANAANEAACISNHPPIDQSLTTSQS